MNIFSRGIRNAFRNVIRTFSIVVILGLSIGLSLTMLVAHQAVSNKITSVKGAIGNTITIQPAGFSGFSQVNNSLTSSQLGKVKDLPHITALTETLTDRLTTIGSSQPMGPFGAMADSSTNTTSLTSPVVLNADGNGGFSSAGGDGPKLFISGGGQLPANFSLPITLVGTNTPSIVNNSTLTITSGKAIDGAKDADQAMISSAMASKNNLQIGSTFTAYNETITVGGIFSSNNKGSDNMVIMSLPTVQRLSGQSGDVTAAVATVDSLDNITSATTAIKNTLGSSADVTSGEDQANQAVQPLNSVKTIALYSLIGAVVAGSLIILLTMVMIVRERKREIGVLKAIGASNVSIMFQFMVEAVTLTVLGAVIGILLGVAAGNPITKLLVDNSTSSSIADRPGSSVGPGPVRFAGGGGGEVSRQGFVNSSFRGLRGDVSNIHAAIGWTIIIDGLVAALVIAVIGSALASFFIAKIRPAEVMRQE